LSLQLSPQQFLNTKLQERGYLTRHRTFATKRTAYFNQPTAHQKASYGSRMITIIKQGQVKAMVQMMEAGLSPNACNTHGESLLHMICRRGNWDLFQVLVGAHVDLQVADDYGRTPLHDACWSSYPNFSLVRHLVQTDVNFLFLEDARGSLPLAYVPKPHWALWNGFLAQVLDELFPLDKATDESVPSLCRGAPDSRPVRDPTNVVLPATLANMVANGSMAPSDVLLAMTELSGEDRLMTSDNDDDDDSESDDDDASLADTPYHRSTSAGLVVVPDADNFAKMMASATSLGDSDLSNNVTGEDMHDGEYTTDDHDEVDDEDEEDVEDCNEYEEDD
jgi:ankyrin repeat protein